MFIIGLDLGSCNSFPSFIPAPGGRPVDLLPPDNNTGIPSVFFYSKKAADRCKTNNTVPPPWCGFDAVGGRATPLKNRVRYLKVNMSKPLVLDDWAGTYDEAITALIQYIVRLANKYLEQNTTETSNCLSLAHPATFTRAQCQRLKQLAERAELEDGRHVKVVGMIAEPAAAALDYLVDNGRADNDCTVLTYDLGGSTFDLSIVSAHPQGIQSPQGNIRYYDIEKLGGDETLGGMKFDAVMRNILEANIPAGSRVSDSTLNRLAETAKIDMSARDEECYSVIDDTGEEIEITVTRAEFERAAKPLVDIAIKATRDILDGYTGKAPELIVLTGGASQMPMIKASLEREFPQYRGKVAMYRPSRAISYGAARFGVNEDDVQRRVARDLAIRFYDRKTGHPFASRFIAAGTPIPYSSPGSPAWNINPRAKASRFSVCEARVEHPDSRELERDYREIMSATIHHPPGAQMTVWLSVDELGLLRVEAAQSDNLSNKVDATCMLENLST